MVTERVNYIIILISLFFSCTPSTREPSGLPTSKTLDTPAGIPSANEISAFVISRMYTPACPNLVNELDGKIKVVMMVDSNDKIVSATCLTPVPGCPDLKLQIEKILTDLPGCRAGKKNNQIISSSVETEIELYKINENIGEERVYEQTALSVLPEFPGGMMKLHAFIDRNVHYPDSARGSHVQGKIFVWFVIEKTGLVTHWFRIPLNPGKAMKQDLQTWWS